MKIKPITLYILVSFAFSWGIALIIHWLGGFKASGIWLTPTLLLYMSGPMVGALICVWRLEKGRRMEALGLRQPHWPSMPIAWLAGLLLVGGALILTLLVPGYSLGDPLAASVSMIEATPDLSDFEREQSLNAMSQPGMGATLAFMAIILGPLINMPLMLSEELGWRGYLWDRLKRNGFWRASVITGLLWGVWHMPIIWLGHNYPEAPLIGSVVFVLLCLLMSPLYSWLRIKTRSIWGPALLHGTTNATAGYFILLQDPTDQPWQGLLGIGGFITAALICCLIWAQMRRAERRASG